MGKARYRLTAGAVFLLKYHLVWCPKYRRPVLVGMVADDLRTLLYQKATELSVEIQALEIRPDHVHLLVSVLPVYAPQHLANQFKGFTSRLLRQKYPELKSRLPSLWSRSYYVGSVGHVSDKTVQAYIEAQQRS
jgi:REP-associated tyrosine transposase